MFKIKRNLFSAKIIQIVIIFEVMKMTTALQCYVCGDSSNFLYDSDINFNSTSSLTSDCEDLNRHWNSSKILNDSELNKFKIQCPENYLGCTTHIQDNHIARSCDIFPIDDCQIANGIKYCYCNSDLCNGSEESARIHQLEQSYQQRLKSSANYYNMPDDEDYERDSEDDDGLEMSGNGDSDDFIEHSPSSKTSKTKEITSSTAKNEDKYFMEKLKNIMIATSNNNKNNSNKNSKGNKSTKSSTTKTTSIPIINQRTTVEQPQDEIILKDNIEHDLPLITTTKTDAKEVQTERITTTVRNSTSVNNNKSQYDDDRDNKNSSNKYKLDFKLIILFLSLKLYHIIY